MTKGQRTIVALLAVVAVLLGLNLLSGTPEAEAQVEEGLPTSGACCLPSGVCQSIGEATCDTRGGVFQGVGTLCLSFDCFPRRLVSVTVNSGGGDNLYRVFRAWNNGDVDSTWMAFNDNLGAECEIIDECGPVPIIPPPCPADVNDENVFLPHST